MSAEMDTPIVRPRVVSAAYWLWLASAVLLIVICMIALTLPADQIRASFSSAEQGDSFLTVFRGLGVISGLVGLAVGLMSSHVRGGDRRFRRALVSLSGAAAMMLIFAGLVFPFVPLVITVGLIIAAVLVYRPSAREWFQREQ
ncbi:putative uncharacterized protein [Rhodococcus sp. AW25M09]|uniref:hypothetical protein n=1 Tax=Rhodococcus sp. AW25M09 TaxID=1268303 RepID=UPI0002AC22EA|nr:hypothetical protein [Rhodococcus sp. AW25M09]CCQ15148.1 putative uncharacterized protein [Rhodococcus sp. AW25M09]